MLFDDKAGQERVQAIRRMDKPAGPKPWGWTRDWASLGVAALGVIALVGISIAAMIFAMSERRQLTELRSHTEDRLSSIDRELGALGAGIGQLIASNEGSKPDFSARYLDMLRENSKRATDNADPILAMEIAAAVTKKARELKMHSDEDRIAAAGREFLRLVAADRPPISVNDRLSLPAMETVGELMGYRSFLLPNPLGQTQDGTLAHSAMLTLPKLHAFKPLDSESKISGFMRSLVAAAGHGGARIGLLDRAESMLSAEAFGALLVDGYDLKIDGLDARDVVFINSKITYSGGKLVLDNIYFTNCTFQLNELGGDFARAALSPSGQVTITK